MTINLLELQMPKENRKRSKNGDRPPRPSKPSRPEPSKTRWCHICRVYNPDHQLEFCPTTTCLSCGGKGHQKPRCPYLRCDLCNEMGHISIVCSLQRIHRASQRSASKAQPSPSSPVPTSHPDLPLSAPKPAPSSSQATPVSDTDPPGARAQPSVSYAGTVRGTGAGVSPDRGPEWTIKKMVSGLRSFSATFGRVALENQLVDLDQQEAKLKEEMRLRLATIREDRARVQQPLDAARDFAEPFQTLSGAL